MRLTILQASKIIKNKEELLHKASYLSGLTLNEFALEMNHVVPKNLNNAKGWLGQLMERYLGAKAGSRPMPDFPELGIELKTIPVDFNGKPLESTYICVVPLLFDGLIYFEESLFFKKTSHVLWIPIEGTKEKPVATRRIGQAFFWKPSFHDLTILRRDWEEHMDKIRLGEVQTISARDGQYLQIRPKAACRTSRRLGIDAQGQLTPTLPLGFYLRASFTAQILKEVFPY